MSLSCNLLTIVAAAVLQRGAAAIGRNAHASRGGLSAAVLSQSTILLCNLRLALAGMFCLKSVYIRHSKRIGEYEKMEVFPSSKSIFLDNDAYWAASCLVQHRGTSIL